MAAHQKLCEDFGVAVTQGAGLFANLLALTMHVLQVDEEAALDIMQQRLVSPSVAASLQSSDIIDALDDRDLPRLG
eukprot:389080-Prorocentrum_lima.AAC.1